MRHVFAPIVFIKKAATPHPQPARHSTRRRVADLDASKDLRQRQRSKAQPQTGVCRLHRVPLSPVRPCQHIPNFRDIEITHARSGPLRRRRPCRNRFRRSLIILQRTYAQTLLHGQAALSDELASRAQGDRQRPITSRGVTVLLSGDPCPNLLIRQGMPPGVHDLRILQIAANSREIAFLHRPQETAGSRYLKHILLPVRKTRTHQKSAKRLPNVPTHHAAVNLSSFREALAACHGAYRAKALAKLFCSILTSDTSDRLKYGMAAPLENKKSDNRLFPCYTLPTLHVSTQH